MTRIAAIEALSELDVDSDHDIKGPLKGVTTLVLPSPINNMVDP